MKQIGLAALLEFDRRYLEQFYGDDGSAIIIYLEARHFSQNIRPRNVPGYFALQLLFGVVDQEENSDFWDVYAASTLT